MSSERRRKLSSSTETYYTWSAKSETAFRANTQRCVCSETFSVRHARLCNTDRDAGSWRMLSGVLRCATFKRQFQDPVDSQSGSGTDHVAPSHVHR